MHHCVVFLVGTNLNLGSQSNAQCSVGESKNYSIRIKNQCGCVIYRANCKIYKWKGEACDSVACHLHPVKPIKVSLQKRNFSHSKNSNSQIANCEKWQLFLISFCFQKRFLKNMGQEEWEYREKFSGINLATYIYQYTSTNMHLKVSNGFSWAMWVAKKSPLKNTIDCESKCTIARQRRKTLNSKHKRGPLLCFL